MGEWVTQWRVEFLGREWNFVDIGSVVVVLALHLLTLLAPFHFTWPAFWVAVALYFVVGVSVNLSYHRQLSHRSFKLPKWLEYFFAYCGVLSFQRSPLEWVSIHRSHHQFTDTLKDPHSPVRGFWYSHIGWIFDFRSRFGKVQRPTETQKKRKALLSNNMNNQTRQLEEKLETEINGGKI
ncbi:hypothetical protein C1H46_014232 [Malus baccata]|uniref:Fatty acid desaturase domain-containing protein n=1 Tax=Malus baccata TaxID=106549 RepID=A0A540MN00_MALBA|nr:hypothetical protein C1H46_014232 [Malus baccata]